MFQVGGETERSRNFEASGAGAGGGHSGGLEPEGSVHVMLPTMNTSGAAEVREVTKAETQSPALRTVSSQPELSSLGHAAPAAVLRQPQGFRRHHIATKKREAGLLDDYRETLYPLLGYFASLDDSGSDSDSEAEVLDDETPNATPTMGAAAGGTILASSRRPSTHRLRRGKRHPRLPGFFSDRALFNPSARPDLSTFDDTDLGHAPLIPKHRKAEVEDAEGGANTAKVVFTLLKAFIASAVLFLPKAFYNGGWVFSPLMLIMMCYLSVLCVSRLIECRQTLGGSFGDIGYQTCGAWGKLGVQAAVVLSQCGFCCVYVAFAASNVHDLLRSWHAATVPAVSVLVVIQLVPLVPMTWVRRLRYFAFSNLVADLLIFVGLMSILGYAVYHMKHTHYSERRIDAFNASDFPVFLGTAVYSFEGIGMMIPIYRSGDEYVKRNFNKIVFWTLTGILAFFILFGLVGYAAFGKDVHSVITFNLPCGEAWVYSLQCMYILALVLTFPVMLFPAVKIIERGLTPALLQPGRPTTNRKWRKNFVRFLLVAIVLVVAIVGGKSLDNFVSIIGAFACVPLAYIFPCLFHLKTFPEQTGFTKWSNIVFIIFGIGVMVFSTVISLKTWGGGSDKSPCKY